MQNEVNVCYKRGDVSKYRSMSFIYVFGKCISELCLMSGLIFADKSLSHGHG